MWTTTTYVFELLLLAAIAGLALAGRSAAAAPTPTVSGEPATGAVAPGAVGVPSPAAPDLTAGTAPIRAPNPPAPPQVYADGTIAPAADPAWYGDLARQTSPPATDAERAYHDEIAALIRTDPESAQFLRYADDP